APDGDRGDRQPGERSGGAGGAEPQRHARTARDPGARMLKVRGVKLGGNELDRPEWLAARADAPKPPEPVVGVHGGGPGVPAPDGDRGDRQPGERSGGAGGAEPQRHARTARDPGARMLKVRVVKLGGNELDRPEWLAACADALKPLEPVVVVHGGGRAVTALSRRLGLPVEKRDGLRVTPPEVAEVVEMVLAGPANRAVVAALRAAGFDAIGLSGVDGGLLTAQPSAAALGHVGEITAVRASLLESLLLAGLTPVVAPVAPAAGREGVPLNVNADHAAAAIAAALRATELLYV